MSRNGQAEAMSQTAEGGVNHLIAKCILRERKTCSRERKTDLRSQVLEPGQSAPVRLSNMIALPAGLRVRKYLDTRGRPRKNATASRERQDDDIRYSALIIKDKLARAVARHQCTRRLGRQPRLSRRPLASEVSQYLHPNVELITIPRTWKNHKVGV